MFSSSLHKFTATKNKAFSIPGPAIYAWIEYRQIHLPNFLQYLIHSQRLLLVLLPRKANSRKAPLSALNFMNAFVDSTSPVTSTELANLLIKGIKDSKISSREPLSHARA
jgi:hypothetical protein